MRCWGVYEGEEESPVLMRDDAQVHNFLEFFQERCGASNHTIYNFDIMPIYKIILGVETAYFFIASQCKKTE